MKDIATNKKGYFDYSILEEIEVGIVLTGDEVKSIRSGHVSLKESYATVRGGEIFLINCNISPYSHAYEKKDDAARRSRKLLLSKKEINKLIGAVSRKGLTLIPLKMYINSRGYIKIKLGIGKHKKAEGKKQIIKERDIKREMEREIKSRK
ncbi:SsrA-binding protein SmpB [Candidatus Babeliales bacterium]|nr:SsrA-binding protein SmpB [Candidatus Babeliales bacterium]